MSSAWDYEANACSKDGKFSAKFEGYEVAMGAPTLGELRLFINSKHCLKLKNEPSSHEKRLSNFDQNLVKVTMRFKFYLAKGRLLAFCFQRTLNF